MISIFELAQEIGTSKTTISRKIRELDIKKGLIVEDGKYYLTDEQANRIREKLKHHKRNEEQAQKPASHEQQIIKKLLHQLEEKDKIIKKQQETIEKQTVLLAQEQQLHKQTLDSLRELSERQNTGIFARLFSRKKEPPKLTGGTASEDPEETKEGND